MLGAPYRFLQGMDYNLEAIGLEAFKEVGHESRFLEIMHAVKYCRSKERWEPKLTDRKNWDTWMQKTGGKDMAQRANEQARKILNEHHPEYVTEQQAGEIDRIAKAAQRYFIKTSSVR